MSKVMNSKFRSTCTACGGTILPDTLIEWTKGAGARHATDELCEAARAERAASKVGTGSLNLKAIADFLYAAQQRGLKHPKLRVLAPDNATEMRLSITAKGVAPGSIALVVGGEFIGCVRPEGTMTSKLAQDTAMQQHLLVVAKDPAAAAKSYAAVKGNCSFCGKSLVEEGSTEVGYGPVCAKKWGLPHHYVGTPVLSPVVKPKAQKLMLDGHQSGHESL